MRRLLSHRRITHPAFQPLRPLALALILAACACGGNDDAGDAAEDRVAPRGFPAPPAVPYVAMTVTNGGMIAGTVRFGGLADADTTIRPTFDVPVCGDEYEERRLMVEDGRVEGAIVWLNDIRAGKPLPRERLFELQHVRCRLTPRVQAVTTGGTLNVRSADPLSHRTRFTHLHSDDDLGVVRQTDRGSVVPVSEAVSRAGLVRVRCDVHPWTTAWIAVFDHPYFVVTDPSGSFAFTEVPPGRYRLVVWHEVLGAMEREVEVRVGETENLEMVYRSLTVGS